MKTVFWTRICCCLALGLLFSAGCNLLEDGLPKAGDKVQPQLVRDIHWKAGRMGELWVELTATSPEGYTRRLGFNASADKDPVASIRFFDSTGELISTTQVVLSERC